MNKAEDKIRKEISVKESLGRKKIFIASLVVKESEMIEAYNNIVNDGYYVEYRKCPRGWFDVIVSW